MDAIFRFPGMFLIRGLTLNRLLRLRCRNSIRSPARILDLGSGSGAIICTLLRELPVTRGVAVDVSPEAREMTALNAEQLGVSNRIDVRAGPWFENVDGAFDLIVSNPPYIPRDDIAGLALDVRDHDPHIALDGGADGLSCYRNIAAGVSRFLSQDGKIIVEIGAGQFEDVVKIFNRFGFTFLNQCVDLGGHVRCLAFGRVLSYSTQ